MAENNQMVLVSEVYVESDPNRGNMIILKERSEDDVFLMFVMTGIHTCQRKRGQSLSD
jgi:hypothetical protein